MNRAEVEKIAREIYASHIETHSKLNIGYIDLNEEQVWAVCVGAAIYRYCFNSKGDKVIDYDKVIVNELGIIPDDQNIDLFTKSVLKKYPLVRKKVCLKNE